MGKISKYKEAILLPILVIERDVAAENSIITETKSHYNEVHFDNSLD